MEARREVMVREEVKRGMICVGGELGEMEVLLLVREGKQGGRIVRMGVGRYVSIYLK